MRKLTALVKDEDAYKVFLRNVARNVKWSKTTRNGALTILSRMEASNA